MTFRAWRSEKAFSLLIIWTIVLGSLLAVLSALAPAAQGGPCDQAGGVITGDWTITTPQVCSDIVYTVDGTININSGGSLTLVNGGLRFAKDGAHTGYALNVNAGGALVLDNSVVTVVTDAIDPYLYLAVTVSGAGSSLAMRNGAMLKFPGWFNASSGASVNVTDSEITGFTDGELSGLFAAPASVDANNDGPIMSWNGASGSFYRSRIARIYEGTTGGANFNLAAGSSLYVYDTYIGVDHSDDTVFHNELRVDGTSNAYLYNATIDEDQSPTARENWLPAFVATAAGGAIYIHRWLHVTTADSYGYPIANATVWSRLSPGSTTAQYPDNGMASTPSSRTLWYLGRTASGDNAWNRTDVNGRATLPLYTDRIDTGTLPNAESFGNYAETAWYNGSTAVGGAYFSAYPDISAEDNNLDLTVSFGDILLAPDLRIEELRVSGGNLASLTQPIGTDISVTAVIRNEGQTNVQNVLVSFFADNVDRNNDGIMDFGADAFRPTVGVADYTIPVIPRNSTANATVVWTPSGTVETTRALSVVVDAPPVIPTDGGAVRETNEANNILIRNFVLYTWPDLSLGPADVTFLADPVANNEVPLRVTVRNDGTNRATGATLSVYEGTTLVSNVVSFDLGPGGSSSLIVAWRPPSTGPHTISVRVSARADVLRNTDYRSTNNEALFTQTVLAQPNLQLRQSEHTVQYSTTQGIAFTIAVRIHNVGQTPAQNVSVGAYLDGDRAVEVGRITGLNVVTELNVTFPIAALKIAGSHTLLVIVDPDDRLNEGGAAEEADNFVNITVDVIPPQGAIVIGLPQNGTELQPGMSLVVQGYVRDRNLNGIGGVALDIAILDRSGTPVVTASTTSQADGLFSVVISVPDLADGGYTVRVSSGSGLISASTAAVTVRRQVPFLFQPVPFIGLAWWMLLLILGAAAGVGLGLTLYWKFYGLGKMVECGECGAFIPEDATSCPKCGVAFEKDMAKCSNCQAWIPVAVKQCPECGVEFATGQVEMADYQEKMRLQYDEIVLKFKDEASRQLGRALTEREFQEWWRKQPTFMTFEDWLREEEEMRKMGSKPCPSCGTLNSVTATVCHKCGSLMREARPPSGGGAAPAAGHPSPAPSGQPQRPVGSPTDAADAAGGTESVPRRIIRKPAPGAPIVQKKIVKRPLGEGQSGDAQGDAGSTSQNPEDEL